MPERNVNTRNSNNNIDNRTSNESDSIGHESGRGVGRIKIYQQYSRNKMELI